LAHGGTAYISVRNDLKKLKGQTAKGTWQGPVNLNLPELKECANYRMFILNYDTILTDSVVWD